MADAVRSSFWRSKGAGFLILILLTVVMTIPLLMLGVITSERQSYSNQTIREVGGVWGAPQSLAGPFLMVPVQRAGVLTQADGKVVPTVETHTLVITPDTLRVEINAQTQTRSRGIFEATVYTAKAGFSGAFDAIDAENLINAGETALWDKAVLAAKVSDSRAFENNMSVSWKGGDIAFEPAFASETRLANGAFPASPNYKGSRAYAPNFGSGGMLQAAIGDPRDVNGAFDFALNIRGSARLHVSPLGRQTDVTISSDWPHPSFDGAFLPKSRSISDAGFEASWSVPYLARGFPATWTVPQKSHLGSAIGNSSFGVSFYQPVNFYQKVERSLKYAVLFVGLSFLTVFLIEGATGKRTHAVQYLLVGLAECVFFLLLLALSEQIGFTPAYLIAAGATIVLLTGYVATAMGGGKATWMAFAAFVTLYGFLYLLLQSQDYALLIGAVAAFLSIAVTMVATRNVNWWADEN